MFTDFSYLLVLLSLNMQPSVCAILKAAGTNAGLSPVSLRHR